MTPQRPRSLGVVHSSVLGDAAVATSRIGRRSWLYAGRPMHHLLDPSTGEPAFTGVVQATALAPTGVEAEWRAKAAVLSGPVGAPDRLPHGGVLVLDDGSHVLVDGPLRARADRVAQTPWRLSHSARPPSATSRRRSRRRSPSRP